MLKKAAFVVVIILASIGMLWLEGVSGPLSELIEENFVALTLVLLIPLLMPWIE